MAAFFIPNLSRQRRHGGLVLQEVLHKTGVFRQGKENEIIKKR